MKLARPVPLLMLLSLLLFFDAVVVQAELKCWEDQKLGNYSRCTCPEGFASIKGSAEYYQFPDLVVCGKTCKTADDCKDGVCESVDSISLCSCSFSSSLTKLYPLKDGSCGCPEGFGKATNGTKTVCYKGCSNDSDCVGAAYGSTCNLKKGGCGLEDTAFIDVEPKSTTPEHKGTGTTEKDDGDGEGQGSGGNGSIAAEPEESSDDSDDGLNTDLIIGIVIGVIVVVISVIVVLALVGGVVAFVLIKRKKKAKVALAGGGADPAKPGDAPNPQLSAKQDTASPPAP